jgi:hypothetical protein
MDENLEGGVANAGQVVRHGEFVLRPSNPNSQSIHTFLLALRSTGFDGASVPLEVQPDGRERLLFIAGDVPLPPYPMWAQSNETLESIARLLLRFHEASVQVPIGSGTWSDELADPAGGPMVCHNDVCLENVVFRNGEAIGLLDFDFAAPGRPAHDLAAFARMCVPVDDDRSAERLGWAPTDRPARLRRIAAAYELGDSGRQELLEHLDRSMEQGGVFVRRRVEAGDLNFTRMLAAMGGMERYQRRREWWKINRRHFVAALL